MEARCEEILRKTKVVSRPLLTLVLVDLQTYFTRQNMSFWISLGTYFLHGRKPWNTRKKNATTRECFARFEEPLFRIIRLTLRPLIEDTSDKSKTLEGVTLQQKTPYLIYIWTWQGSLVNLSTYIFQICRMFWKIMRSGKHVQHLDVFLFFNLVHCSIYILL